jgi:antitoxin component HigA of HigAB toxin-antitoxin module
MTRADMQIRPIRTARDHERAVARITELMSARPGTPEGDELDALATLVNTYEAKHHAMDAPKKDRSGRLAVVQETASDFHKAGLIDAQTMREFDKLV